MEQIKIRRFIEDDREILKNIYFKIRIEEFRWVDKNTINIDDFESSTEGESILVAIINENIVGFASIWNQDKFIHNLFVTKEFRRFGVGKRLLDEVTKIWGTPLTLKCVRANSNAVEFYTKNGWECVREELGTEGPYYLMRYSTVINTERLSLRRLRKDDFSSLCTILQDEEVMYAYEHAFSDQEVEEWFDKQLKRYETDGVGLWAVILKETNKMIGQCGLTIQDCEGKQVLEIGYLFRKDFWNKGYATEAAIACKKYAFDILKVEEVFSIIRDTNIASQNVALRNGMTIKSKFTKYYYGVDMPHLVYSTTKEDYNK